LCFNLTILQAEFKSARQLKESISAK
jgi:hypothetical protein